MNALTILTAPHAPRCTNATVEALTGQMPDRLLLYGTSVLEELQRQGYEIELAWGLGYKTLRGMIRNMPKGSYYIATSGHAMALVDGVLTDTEGRGFDKRRIQAIFKVVPL